MEEVGGDDPNAERRKKRKAEQREGEEPSEMVGPDLKRLKKSMPGSNLVDYQELLLDNLPSSEKY